MTLLSRTRLLLSIFKGQDEFGSHVDFAFHGNAASQTVDVVVHQIESNSFTVYMIVEFLVQAKNFVFYHVHVKSLAIVGKNQLAGSILFLGRNGDNGQPTRHGIFDGIRD